MSKKIQAGCLLIFLGLAFSAAGSQAASVTVFGHNLSEPAFGVVIDLNQPDHDPKTTANVLKDFTTPSSHEPDSDPAINNKFFLAYTSQKGFETVYLSLMEHSQIRSTQNGEDPATQKLRQFNVTSPFQMQITHYQSPQGRDILVVNTYEGLLAYMTPSVAQTRTGKALRPTDTILTGNTFSSQYILSLLSRTLLPNANETYQWNAVPFFEYNQIDNTYTYGITFSNILVTWHRVQLERPSNESIYIPPSEEIAALTLLDHLTFRHHLNFIDDPKQTSAVVSSTYDIGSVLALGLHVNPQERVIAQVLNDNAALNGLVITGSIQKSQFVLYTEEKATARLRGIQNGNGLGLIVLSSMNFFSIAPPGFRIDAGPTSNSLAAQNQNITKAVDIELIGERVFEADFTQKPTYSLILPNSTQITGLPVFQTTVAANRIHLDQFQQSRYLTNILLFQFAKWLSPVFRFQMNDKNGPSIQRITETGLDLQHSKAFLAIQFPLWQGLDIFHDPVFIAYGRSETQSLLHENIFYFIVMTMIVLVLVVRPKRQT